MLPILQGGDAGGSVTGRTSMDTGGSFGDDMVSGLTAIQNQVSGHGHFL